MTRKLEIEHVLAAMALGMTRRYIDEMVLLPIEINHHLFLYFLMLFWFGLLLSPKLIFNKI